MGTGVTGRYYTTHGSKRIHHKALIHSFEGEYIKHKVTGEYYRVKSGGHGQTALNFMDSHNIRYNVVKTYSNGVRIGNIPNAKTASKRTGTNMAWFPKSWTPKDIIRAAEHVTQLKHNWHTPDRVTMWGAYKGVRVGVKRVNGTVVTVFPCAKYQPQKGKKI